MGRTRNRVGWVGVAFAGLSLALLAMWGTGVLLYGLSATESMEMSDLQATVRRAAAVAHGVIAWLVCVLCGRGVWPHVQWMFHHRRDTRQWGWGLVNASVLAVLLVSGLVLLYGTPGMHEIMSFGHGWVGALAPVPYLLHGWGKRSQGL